MYSGDPWKCFCIVRNFKLTLVGLAIALICERITEERSKGLHERISGQKTGGLKDGWHLTWHTRGGEIEL